MNNMISKGDTEPVVVFYLTHSDANFITLLSKLSRLELDNKQLQHDNEILKHDLTMARR